MKRIPINKARVYRLLARGKRVKEVADTIGVSCTTLRSRLKQWDPCARCPKCGQVING